MQGMSGNEVIDVFDFVFALDVIFTVLVSN